MKRIRWSLNLYLKIVLFLSFSSSSTNDAYTKCFSWTRNSWRTSTQRRITKSSSTTWTTTTSKKSTKCAPKASIPTFTAPTAEVIIRIRVVGLNSRSHVKKSSHRHVAFIRFSRRCLTSLKFNANGCAFIFIIVAISVVLHITKFSIYETRDRVLDRNVTQLKMSCPTIFIPKSSKFSSFWRPKTWTRAASRRTAWRLFFTTKLNCESIMEGFIDSGPPREIELEGF